MLKILFVLYRIHTPVRFVGCSLLPDALAAKLDAQNAFELAENLLVRDSLALLVLLNNLRLFVNLLRQLRLRELLRQSTLKNRLLHVGAHRLVRQVFVVELKLERVTSRPRVYARAVNNKKISSVSQSLSIDAFGPPGFVSSVEFRVPLSLVALSRRSYPSSPFAPPYQPEAPARARKTTSLSQSSPIVLTRSVPFVPFPPRVHRNDRTKKPNLQSSPRILSESCRVVVVSSSRARTAATALGSFAAFADPPLPVALGRFPIVISFQSWWCPDMMMSVMLRKQSQSVESTIRDRDVVVFVFKLNWMHRRKWCSTMVEYTVYKPIINPSHKIIPI